MIFTAASLCGIRYTIHLLPFSPQFYPLRLSWRSLNHKNIRQVISDNDLVPLKASVMETLSILDLGAAAELTGKR